MKRRYRDAKLIIFLTSIKILNILPNKPYIYLPVLFYPPDLLFLHIEVMVNDSRPLRETGRVIKNVKINVDV
jgi:hypothetical protein